MSSNYSVKFYYHDGSINKVDASTKEAVKSAVDKAIDKVSNKELFRNLKIHVASDYSNLPINGSEFNNYLKINENSMATIRGITIDDLERKEIFMQESAFWIIKIKNLFSFSSFYSAKKEIEQATMHELGHQYNYLGGNKELHTKHQQLQNKYYGKPDNEINLLPSEEKIMEQYLKNNEYSDKKEFKQALEKDLKNLKLSYSIKMNFGYIIGEFYNRGLDIKPNMNDIEMADYCRGEMFAQAFSYAMGTDDGNKEDFIKLFPNTYNLVKKYITNE